MRNGYIVGLFRNTERPINTGRNRAFATVRSDRCNTRPSDRGGL